MFFLTNETGTRIKYWLTLYELKNLSWAKRLLLQLEKYRQLNGHYEIPPNLLEELKQRLEEQAKKADFWAIDILRNMP